MNKFIAYMFTINIITTKLFIFREFDDCEQVVVKLLIVNMYAVNLLIVNVYILIMMILIMYVMSMLIMYKYVVNM